MSRNGNRYYKGLFRLSGSRRSVERSIAVLAVLSVTACTMVFLAKAYSGSPSGPPLSITPKAAETIPTAAQRISSSRSEFNIRLSLQPEADRLRNRLGRRFTRSGLEVSELLGTLTIGNRSEPIRMTRSHDAEGETVEIAVGGSSPRLTWDENEGARVSTSAATGEERSVIERLVLDSPDQFIFAQLRGAAYHTMSHNVRPAEAGGADEYDGPVWDLVRIDDSTSRSRNRPQSASRIYFLNSSTGLIDRILSREEDQTIEAVLSSWVNEGGEVSPTHITWKKGNQVLMELNITNVALRSR